ncbi:hypothetical protein Q4R57_14645, partial [Morganella morganii]
MDGANRSDRDVFTASFRFYPLAAEARNNRIRVLSGFRKAKSPSETGFQNLAGVPGFEPGNA